MKVSRTLGRALSHATRLLTLSGLLAWAASGASAQSLEPVKMEVTLDVTWNETIGSTTGLNNGSTSDTWVAKIDILAATLMAYPDCPGAPCPVVVDVSEADDQLIEINIDSTSQIPAEHPAIRATSTNTFAKFFFESNANGSGTESFYFLDTKSGIYYPTDGTGSISWRFDRRFTTPLLPAGTIERTTAGFVDTLRDNSLVYDVSERLINNTLQVAYNKTGTARITNVRVITEPTTTPPAICRYQMVSDWGTGFVGFVYIKNETQEPINGWQIGLKFQQPVSITNYWSTALTGGGGSLTAVPLTWNQMIYPGQEINFGLQGSKLAGQSSAATVGGGICR